MTTLKFAAGIAAAVCLIGWRLVMAVGDVDPILYVSLVQTVPNLVIWVKICLVALVIGYLVIVGNAVLNEMDAAADRQKRWTDMRQHVEKELTVSVTRSVRASYREREERLDVLQGKLELVDREQQERTHTISIREQDLEARSREVDTARAEVIPLRRQFEESSATLDSIIQVTREDQTEILKILTKAHKWVKMAIEDPEKFVSESKAGRVNSGWLERLSRKLHAIEIRVEGTKQETAVITAKLAESLEKPMSHLSSEGTL